MVVSRRAAVILLLVLTIVPAAASLAFAAQGSSLAGLFQALTMMGAVVGIVVLYRSFGESMSTAVLMAVLSAPVVLVLIIVLSILTNCMVDGCYV